MKNRAHVQTEEAPNILDRIVTVLQFGPVMSDEEISDKTYDKTVDEDEHVQVIAEGLLFLKGRGVVCNPLKEKWGLVGGESLRTFTNNTDMFERLFAEHKKTQLGEPLCRTRKYEKEIPIALAGRRRGLNYKALAMVMGVKNRLDLKPAMANLIRNKIMERTLCGKYRLREESPASSRNKARKKVPPTSRPASAAPPQPAPGGFSSDQEAAIVESLKGQALRAYEIRDSLLDHPHFQNVSYTDLEWRDRLGKMENKGLVLESVDNTETRFWIAGSRNSILLKVLAYFQENDFLTVFGADKAMCRHLGLAFSAKRAVGAFLHRNIASECLAYACVDNKAVYTHPDTTLPAGGQFVTLRGVHSALHALGHSATAAEIADTMGFTAAYVNWAVMSILRGLEARHRVERVGATAGRDRIYKARPWPSHEIITDDCAPVILAQPKAVQQPVKKPQAPPVSITEPTPPQEERGISEALQSWRASIREAAKTQLAAFQKDVNEAEQRLLAELENHYDGLSRPVDPEVQRKVDMVDVLSKSGLVNLDGLYHQALLSK